MASQLMWELENVVRCSYSSDARDTLCDVGYFLRGRIFVTPPRASTSRAAVVTSFVVTLQQNTSHGKYSPSHPVI